MDVGNERKKLAEQLHRTGESLLGQLEEELGAMDEELRAANETIAAKDEAIAAKNAMLANVKEENAQLSNRLKNVRKDLLQWAENIQEGV